MLKNITGLMCRIYAISNTLQNIEQLLINNEIEKLISNSCHKDNKNLVPHSYKIYSQNMEDGIIREIFNRIGYTNKTFVEFGVGNGLENNTLSLLLEDWKGLWIEGELNNVNQARTHLPNMIANGKLILSHAFITKDNINELIRSHIKENEIDLLSVDIDGNDCEVFLSINCINPRVVVIEYNAKFKPPVNYCMKYDASHTWKEDDNFGASLKYLEIEFDKKNYALVGCDITGVNAFFVRKDLLGDSFKSPYTAENHYEPARYHLMGIRSGHPATYKTVDEAKR